MPVARRLGSGTDLGRRCERPLDGLMDRQLDLFRSRARARCIDERTSDAGLRLCVAIIVPAVVVFSVVSGKQVHYLLPEMPFVALAIARLAIKEQMNRAISHRALRAPAQPAAPISSSRRTTSSIA